MKVGSTSPIIFIAAYYWNKVFQKPSTLRIPNSRLQTEILILKFRNGCKITVNHCKKWVLPTTNLSCWNARLLKSTTMVNSRYLCIYMSHCVRVYGLPCQLQHSSFCNKGISTNELLFSTYDANFLTITRAQWSVTFVKSYRRTHGSYRSNKRPMLPVLVISCEI